MVSRDTGVPIENEDIQQSQSKEHTIPLSYQKTFEHPVTPLCSLSTKAFSSKSVKPGCDTNTSTNPPTAGANFNTELEYLIFC